MAPQLPTNNQLLSTKESLPSGFPRRLLFLSAGLFLITLLAYLGLAVGYKSFLKRSIADSERKLESLGARISPEGQKELTGLYSQISNLETILPSHVKTLPLLSFLEKNTGTKVAYRAVDLKVPDRKLVIEGLTASYDDLVKQLVLYESASEVERSTLESAETIGGIVRFKVSLVLKPEVFTPTPQ